MRSIPWKQILLSLGFIIVIVWRIPFASLRAAFRNLEMSNLLLAIFSLLVLLFVRAYKWHLLMAAAGNPHLRRSLRALFGGFALGLIAPGRLGELGRCAFVREDERTQVALLTVLDRMLDSWALLTAIIASLFLLAPRPAAVFGVAAWLAFLPVVMGFPAVVSQLSQLAEKSRYFRGRFKAAAAGMPLVPTPRLALMAVVAMGLELASFFFLLRAFFPTEFTTALATYPFIVLAGGLPVSFSGVGVREGAAALLLSTYAVPASAAVDASLMWFVFAMLLPAALGALWLASERVRSQERNLEGAPKKADRTWVPVAPPPTANSMSANLTP